MRELTPSQIRYLRLRAQRLIPAGLSPLNPSELLRDLCGVQAQDLPAANLALRPRAPGLHLADVEQARNSDGSIVRTWAMRSTLHLLAAADLRWLLRLLGPVFVQKSRRRYQELDLSEAFCARAIGALPGILAGQRAMRRSQLADELRKRGFPTTGQATYHLLGRAALEGVICYGPDQDGRPAFVLLDEWVPAGENPQDREAALALLARRYLSAYGPANVKDLARWSGLSIKESRAGLGLIAGDLLEVQSAGSPYWILQSHAHWLEDQNPKYIVRFLPAFDTYLLGYNGRDLAVPQPYAKRVHPGGGMLRATIIIDGVAAGTWQQKRKKDVWSVRVEPFADLNQDVLTALAEEVQDLGRYQGVRTVLEVVK